ncbi:MAG: hypothetical protein NTY46_01705, partial [Candidatus Sumerlaeota bacterium]|nr:hypothetical protein [Candidatus Sumerlaeota bacterium]
RVRCATVAPLASTNITEFQLLVIRFILLINKQANAFVLFGSSDHGQMFDFGFDHIQFAYQYSWLFLEIAEFRRLLL